jgi:DNA polymerase III subunit gamma/tau
MSEFIVSARKYRPTKFSDVIGQAHVSETLKNAMKTGHVGHAFLFCGPRGVGKTTNARILAKVLNCFDLSADFEPCNVCESCKAFNDNASFNIFELDAASNNSVDNIRTLVEQVRFAPQIGKYKIYIIDEVHALSSNAFNAFLKTLEEPPSHAIFILATTEKHKILPTILSRCQIFDFKRIQVNDIVKQLQIICDNEKIDADPDALHIIALKADGAMRDALSIFDRIVSGCGDKMHYNDVIENLNILDYDYFFRIVDCFLAEDLSGMIMIFDEIIKKGFDPEIFISGLMEHLRNVMMCKDPNTLNLIEAGVNLKERYRNQASISPASLLITALNLANDCDINAKQARNKRLHVEIYLIKMLYINKAFLFTSMDDDANEKKKLANTIIAKIDTPIAQNTISNISETLQESGNKPQVIQKTAETVSLPTIPIVDKLPIETTIQPSFETIIVAAAPEIVKDEIQPIAYATSEVEDNIPNPSISRTKGITKVSPNAMLSNVALELPKSFNMTDLAAMIEEESKILEATVSTLSFQNLTKSWEKYTESCDSVVVKNILSSAIFDIEDKNIIVRIGNDMGKSIILGENELMPFLRFDLSTPELTLSIDVDSSLLPPDSDQNIKRIYSLKEKWELMTTINPLVVDLIKKLDMQRDE